MPCEQWLCVKQTREQDWAVLTNSAQTLPCWSCWTHTYACKVHGAVDSAHARAKLGTVHISRETW